MKALMDIHKVEILVDGKVAGLALGSFIPYAIANFMANGQGKVLVLSPVGEGKKFCLAMSHDGTSLQLGEEEEIFA